jgi:hypothetical protein
MTAHCRAMSCHSMSCPVAWWTIQLRRCMACDRPLEKLDERPGPHIPNFQVGTEEHAVMQSAWATLALLSCDFLPHAPHMPRCAPAVKVHCWPLICPLDRCLPLPLPVVPIMLLLLSHLPTPTDAWVCGVRHQSPLFSSCCFPVPQMPIRVPAASDALTKAALSHARPGTSSTPLSPEASHHNTRGGSPLHKKAYDPSQRGPQTWWVTAVYSGWPYACTIEQAHSRHRAS